MNPLVLVAAGGLMVGMLIGQQTPRATAETPEAYVYELRTYTTLPGRLPNLHARFRDHTMRLFEKHGMKNVVYLTPKEGENTLAYLLAHKSVEAAKASFASFVQDPEWIAARDASELDGKIVDKIESVFYDPTDYSPLK
jgi:hypothetical protein